VAHHYLGHVRELEALLSKAVRASDPGWVTRSPAPSGRPSRRTSIPLNEIPPPPSKRPGSQNLDAARVQACLDENDGNIETTWRALGFTNRQVLTRIIKKHRLRTR
jgi:transcriptional regulator with GAF, ATPase, and Fis domain